MTGRDLRIGRLAEAVGLTVRTLRYYDSVGLLRPSGRTEAGHRLYAAADVRRLYQVLALRRLGLSLGQIANVLDGDHVSLDAILEQHLEQVDREIGAQSALRDRLALALATLKQAKQPLVEELIDVMEHMAMLERYLTPEQLAKLREQRSRLGADGMANVWEERAELIAELDAARRTGEDSASPHVEELRRRFAELHERFLGDDAGVLHSLQAMVETEGVEAASAGTISAELHAYLGAMGKTEDGSAAHSPVDDR